VTVIFSQQTVNRSKHTGKSPFYAVATEIWALYWRYLLLMLLLLPTMAWLNDQLGLMTRLVQATALWPTAFWSLVALFFLLATWIENNGLTFVFFGKRLQLGAAVWRRFNLVLILLFIALALAALAVHPMVSLEVWSLYKLYGQSAALLLVPLLAAWLSTVR